MAMLGLFVGNFPSESPSMAIGPFQRNVSPARYDPF